MRQPRNWLLSLAIIGLSAPSASAGLVPIGPGDFAPGATVITFETGTTALPTVPGASFLNEGIPNSPGWFAGSSNFSGFFGDQGWSNLVSLTFSDLGLAFDTPVFAVGGYFGPIPNFLNDPAEELVVELFDASSASLGSQTFSISPTAAPQFFGFASTTGIARMELRVNNTGFLGFDNITFGRPLAAVPEPGTALLTALGIGLAGLAGVRQRRAVRSR